MLLLFDFSLNNVACYSVSEKLNKLLNYVIEYETPKVVTVHNVSIGLIRWIIHAVLCLSKTFQTRLKHEQTTLSDLSDEDQRVLLSILVSRREEPICQCVTLEMSAPNSFNAGTIDIVASWPSLKTIATDQSNDPLSLLRRSLQLLVVLYVTLYQLWYAQGYQEFSTVESSTTTKVSCILSPTERKPELLLRRATGLLCCITAQRHQV